MRHGSISGSSTSGTGSGRMPSTATSPRPSWSGRSATSRRGGTSGSPPPPCAAGRGSQSVASVRNCDPRGCRTDRGRLRVRSGSGSIQGRRRRRWSGATASIRPAHAWPASPSRRPVHRWADIVLHDGVPGEYRDENGTRWQVFDELERSEPSDVPTVLATVNPDTTDALDDLIAAVERAGCVARTGPATSERCALRAAKVCPMGRTPRQRWRADSRASSPSPAKASSSPRSSGAGSGAPAVSADSVDVAG